MIAIYQIARKVHLWVGLILALVIIMEAVTGLLLAEPWLVGREKTQQHGGSLSESQQKGLTNEQNTARPQREAIGKQKAPAGEITAFAFAKGLHSGRIGDWNFKWLVDLTAIGLIILTLTGIQLSIPILRARRHRNRR